MDEERIREEINRRSEKVTEDDLKKAVESSGEILTKVKSSSFLSKQLAKVELLIMMLKDFWNGEYTEVPWGIIASIVAVLLYILSPIDLIPDFIPVIGYTVDVAFLLLVWAGLSHEVEKYCKWKSQRDEKAKALYSVAFG
jgi:uncharacterized membrane protein YkvA (DUF1232 family)